MTYFCFIESSILTVPHMEPLESTTHEDAVREAIDLMRLHASAIAVHVFLGEERIASVLASGDVDGLSFPDTRQNDAI